MDIFPTEILFKIFNYLNTKDKLMIGFTCMSFRKIIISKNFWDYDRISNNLKFVWNLKKKVISPIKTKDARMKFFSVKKKVIVLDSCICHSGFNYDKHGKIIRENKQNHENSFFLCFFFLKDYYVVAQNNGIKIYSLLNYTQVGSIEGETITNFCDTDDNTIVFEKNRIIKIYNIEGKLLSSINLQGDITNINIKKSKDYLVINKNDQYTLYDLKTNRQHKYNSVRTLNNSVFSYPFIVKIYVGKIWIFNFLNSRKNILNIYAKQIKIYGSLLFIISHRDMLIYDLYTLDKLFEKRFDDHFDSFDINNNFLVFTCDSFLSMYNLNDSKIKYSDLFTIIVIYVVYLFVFIMGVYRLFC